MTKSLSNASDKIGMPPGSLIHVGDVLETESCITLVDYNTSDVEVRQLEDIKQLNGYQKRDSVTWVIIEGLSNVEIIDQIGSMFDVHQLVLEDVLNTHQRPKFEDYDDYLFIVLKSLLAEDKQQFKVSYEQVSILVMDNFVFTFKEKTDDILQPVINRIQTSKGRLRTLGSDYLAYAILDSIIDQCFTLIDSLDETIGALEDELLTEEPTKQTLNTIQKLKREIITIRRNVSPIRELMAAMLRSESALIHEKTHIYLRDVSDHAIRVIESVELHRDILSGLLEIYISSVSNKMNEVMKVLTVFASIFIPLTFLTGIYGMNFEYMPELGWRWGYPVIWLTFISIPVVLLIYFRKKKWL